MLTPLLCLILNYTRCFHYSEGYLAYDTVRRVSHEFIRTTLSLDVTIDTFTADSGVYLPATYHHIGKIDSQSTSCVALRLQFSEPSLSTLSDERG